MLHHVRRAGGRKLSLFDALTNLSLTTNLQFALDAGDSSSYTSGQSWLDRSTNGYDFFRGATGSANTDDPTFNGSAGGLSQNEYWSGDGGDFFRLDQANPTAITDMHKVNAAYSILAAVHFPTLTTTNAVIGTRGNASEVGFVLELTSARKLHMEVINTPGASTNLDATTDDALAASAWHIIGVSIDEATGAGGGFLWADGASMNVSAASTFNADYTGTVATGAAKETIEILARGAAGATCENGFRIGWLALWSGTVLTTANFSSIYGLMRGRHGL